MPQSINSRAKHSFQVAKSTLPYVHSPPSCFAQVLRYMFSSDADPLWVHSDGRIDAPVQACPRCKAPRIFEFQITPQMLYYLEPDNKFVPTTKP